MCATWEGTPSGVEHSANLAYLLRVMCEFNLRGAFALFSDGGTRSFGLSRKEVLERTSEAEVLLNFMGYVRDPEILEKSRNRVFLDIDPGFAQMWQELNLQNICSGHHHYVTVGERIGQPECQVPTGGLEWIATRPPVVLDYWPAQAVSAHGDAFTTIASWRGAYGPVAFRGKTYGLRVHEFRKFFDLPSLTGSKFELALDIHPADGADRVRLEQCGWRLIDPRTVASDPWAYRRYVQGSAAEIMIAKNMYVETQSGWFSDRSTCYLASGRPILAQDTGLTDLYPVGRGLLTFSSLEEAVSGVRDVCANYQAHSHAAREIAAEYFDSDKVLSRLLENLA